MRSTPISLNPELRGAGRMDYCHSKMDFCAYKKAIWDSYYHDENIKMSKKKKKKHALEKK